jgi:acylphosphatase
VAEQEGPGAGRAAVVRLTVVVDGRVQGVGFRWWTRARGLELGLVGTATNLLDGRVEVVVEGPQEACRQLLVLLTENPASLPPPDAHRTWYRRPGAVTGSTHRWSQARGDLSGFLER